uniref:Putative secreted protein n=1 Tax=Anopheles darlingi TaxID=43151 RepID=A0A2M4D2W7_ANODA
MVIVLSQQIRWHLVRQIVVVLLVRAGKLAELVLRFRLLKELLVPQLERLANRCDQVLCQATATLEHIAGAPLVQILCYVRHKIERICVTARSERYSGHVVLGNDFARVHVHQRQVLARDGQRDVSAGVLHVGRIRYAL